MSSPPQSTYNVTVQPPSPQKSHDNGESFIFPMDTYKKDNNVTNHTAMDYLETSPMPSPCSSVTNNCLLYVNEDEDDSFLADRPSLQPKYTNDTMESSNVSNISLATATSAHSSYAPAGHNAVYWSKDNLPSIQSKGKRNGLSSQLIYETMDKYQSLHLHKAQQSSLDGAFTMVDDEESEDDYQSQSDEEEQGEYAHNAIFDCQSDIEYEYESEDALNFCNPPSIITGSTSTDDEYDDIDNGIIEYDEDGDHDASIPNEFRGLSLSFHDATPEPMMNRVNNIEGTRDHFYKLSLTQSEDDEETDDRLMSKRVNNYYKPNKGRKSKKYSPPKHIQQMIDLHKELLSTKRTTKQSKKNRTKRRTTTKSRKPLNYQSKPNLKNTVPAHFEMFNMQTPIDDTNNDKDTFFEFESNFSLQDDDEVMVQQQETFQIQPFHQKTFDFSVPPHRVILSEAACQHLVDLCEYATDDEM